MYTKYLSASFVIYIYIYNIYLYNVTGFNAFGLLLFMFNPTTLFWRIVQVLFCLFLGVVNMELWEECVIDRNKRQVILRKYKFVDISRAKFVIQVPDIEEIHLGQHALGYGGMGKVCYRAEFILNTGKGE